MVRRSNDTPADHQQDEGAAPIDLLQMWISGRDAAAAKAAPPVDRSTDPVQEESSGASSVDAPLPAGPPAESPAGPNDAAEPTSTPELVTPDESTGSVPPSTPVATTTAPAVSPPAPRASAPWATTPPPSSGATRPADNAAGGSWWPYTAPDDAAGPTGAPSTSERPETDEPSDNGLGQRPPDAGAQAPSTAVAGSPADTTDPVATDAPALRTEPRQGGWASFGAAPTAEEVLDQLGPRTTWPTPGVSRRPGESAPGRFAAAETPAPLAPLPPDASPEPVTPVPVALGTPAEAPVEEPAPEDVPPDGIPTEGVPTRGVETDDVAVVEAEPEPGTVAPVAATSVSETAAAASDVAEPQAEVPPAPVATVAPSPEADGPDLSATAHWSLADFESYIREQGGNELSSWMGPRSSSSAAPEPVEDPAEAATATAPAQPVEDPAVAPAPQLVEVRTPDEPQTDELQTDEPQTIEPQTIEPQTAPVGGAAQVTDSARTGSTRWTPTIVPDVVDRDEPEVAVQPTADTPHDDAASVSEASGAASTVPADDAAEARIAEEPKGLLSRIRDAIDPRTTPDDSAVAEPVADPVAEPVVEPVAGSSSEGAIDAVASDEQAWAQPDVEWDDSHDTATELPVVPARPTEAAQPAEALRDGVGPVDIPADEPVLGSVQEPPPAALAPSVADPVQPEADPTEYFEFLRDDASSAPTAPDDLAAGSSEPLDPELPAPVATAIQEPPASYAPSEPTPAPLSILEPAPEQPENEPETTAAVEEPEPETTAVVEEPEPETAAVVEEPEPAAAVEASFEDHQEWHDDQGLRWVSGDGGYTWYSDDGQGWNAEIGEAIEVPPGRRPDDLARTATAVDPAPAAVPEPALVETSEVEPEVQDAEPAAAPAPLPVDSGPDRDQEAFADEVWPATSTGTIPAWRDAEPAPATESMWPGQAPEALPATEAVPTAPASWVGTTETIEPLEPLSAPASSPTQTSTPRTTALDPPPAVEPGLATQASGPGVLGPDALSKEPRVASGDDIPPFVEYKPRGAYRPLLGVLFVAAAILAVVAIFWAVSQGSQAATGIAAGVTGFALAFWWGLLSWTPTIVSLSGSVLEVARGSDGERFDLRSPRLMIDVDDDTGSRNWRTTITRPNGTELVIPASAVDPDEFAMIVLHYRSQAERGQAPQVRGR